ncbi:hypothetical protein [Lacinutrix sp. 5H-3-7-4]|uniref:hypothetical protein n=1 Tax=Lacinutrix sp. (strain 5H-3-7-4) TaxID=983544 RepID=UPI0002DDDBAA|nr:hypothetical protein [Lacinutrix sp. 5H-3-7-4]
MMISLVSNIFILTGILAVLVFLILIISFQQIKIKKQQKKLKKESEQLDSLQNKVSKKYEDFTDGHLYQ